MSTGFTDILAYLAQQGGGGAPSTGGFVDILSWLSGGAIGEPPEPDPGSYSCDGSYEPKPGRVWTFISTPEEGDTTVVIKGDARCVPLWFGFQYPFRYRFSVPYIREQAANNSVTPQTSGRLQMRSWAVNYSGTGFFKISVTPRFRATSTYEWNTNAVGEGESTTDAVVMRDGRFRVPAWGRNDQVTVEIHSCSPLPCSFGTAEWEAEYNQRAKLL